MNGLFLMASAPDAYPIVSAKPTPGVALAQGFAPMFASLLGTGGSPAAAPWFGVEPEQVVSMILGEAPSPSELPAPTADGTRRIPVIGELEPWPKSGPGPRVEQRTAETGFLETVAPDEWASLVPAFQPMTAETLTGVSSQPRVDSSLPVEEGPPVIPQVQASASPALLEAVMARIHDPGSADLAKAVTTQVHVSATPDSVKPVTAGVPMPDVAAPVETASVGVTVPDGAAPFETASARVTIPDVAIPVQSVPTQPDKSDMKVRATPPSPDSASVKGVVEFGAAPHPTSLFPSDGAHPETVMKPIADTVTDVSPMTVQESDVGDAVPTVPSPVTPVKEVVTASVPSEVEQGPDVSQGVSAQPSSNGQDVPGPRPTIQIDERVSVVREEVVPRRNGFAKVQPVPESTEPRSQAPIARSVPSEASSDPVASPRDIEAPVIQAPAGGVDVVATAETEPQAPRMEPMVANATPGNPPVVPEEDGLVTRVASDPSTASVRPLRVERDSPVARPVELARPEGAPGLGQPGSPSYRDVLKAAGPAREQPSSPVVRADRLWDYVVEQARFVQTGERSEFQIHLHPPQLGRVEVVVSRDAEGVTARFCAESEEARTLLESGFGALRTTLAEHGVSLERVEVEVGHGEPQDSTTGGSNTPEFGRNTGSGNQAWNRQSHEPPGSGPERPDPRMGLTQRRQRRAVAAGRVDYVA